MSYTVEAELAAIGQGRILNADPSDLSLSEVTEAYAAIGYLEKVLEARKGQLREVLMSHVAAQGKTNPKGHHELDVGEEKVLRERKLSSAPDEAKVRALLEVKGIPTLDAFDEIKVQLLNPSKLQSLVSIGKLKAEEVEALRNESFALRVTPGPALKRRLNSVCMNESKPQSEQRKR